MTQPSISRADAQRLSDYFESITMDHPDYAVLELSCPSEQPYLHVVGRLILHDEHGPVLFEHGYRRTPWETDRADWFLDRDDVPHAWVLCQVCDRWVGSPVNALTAEIDHLRSEQPDPETLSRDGFHTLWVMAIEESEL